MESNECQERGFVTREPLEPTVFPSASLIAAAFTHIGRRPNQEDRFVIAPTLFGGEYSFFGVFDGTVKEFAAHHVNAIVLDALLEAPAFTAFHALSASDKKTAEAHTLLTKATTETYLNTDAKFLAWAREHKNHYSSCTGVTLLIHNPSKVMAVGHIGDSRIIIGERKEGGHLTGRSLTIDHKPDMPEERGRIEKSGGSLTYLHGGKPFIRGGDFHNRKHAMQLNYSRAFGGKDLKMYGLTAIPTVNLVKLEASSYCVVLGSDGIWDVVDPTRSVQICQQARETKQLPCMELCRVALMEHENKGSADNVTAVCVYLNFTDKSA